MKAMENAVMLEVMLPHFSRSWLFTLRDIAPVIGVLVMTVIILVLVLLIVLWYRFWVKRGMREYERKRGRIRPDSVTI